MRRPVQARYQYSRKNRCIMGRRDVDRRIVGKLMSELPRKAAIDLLKPVP